MSDEKEELEEREAAKDVYVPDNNVEVLQLLVGENVEVAGAGNADGDRCFAVYSAQGEAILVLQIIAVRAVQQEQGRTQQPVRHSPRYNRAGSTYTDIT